MKIERFKIKQRGCYGLTIKEAGLGHGRCGLGWRSVLGSRRRHARAIEDDVVLGEGKSRADGGEQL